MCIRTNHIASSCENTKPHFDGTNSKPLTLTSMSRSVNRSTRAFERALNFSRSTDEDAVAMKEATTLTAARRTRHASSSSSWVTAPTLHERNIRKTWSLKRNGKELANSTVLFPPQ